MIDVWVHVHVWAPWVKICGHHRPPYYITSTSMSCMEYLMLICYGVSFTLASTDGWPLHTWWLVDAESHCGDHTEWHNGPVIIIMHTTWNLFVSGITTDPHMTLVFSLLILLMMFSLFHPRFLTRMDNFYLTILTLNWFGHIVYVLIESHFSGRRVKV